MPNLYTRLCGWSAVLTLLYLTGGDKKYRYNKVAYMNSGDAVIGQKNRVVGYQSMWVEDMLRKKECLAVEDKELLLKVARDSIRSYLKKPVEKQRVDNGEINSKKMDSAFVSIYVKEELRGCIGRFGAKESLVDLVKELAVSAAFEDGRFERVSAEELDDLRVEISVLTPMRKIDDIGQLELGRHGVYLVKDGRKGTFLPQVAIKTGWSKEEFLGHLARDKAHVGWEGWMGADLYVFEAIVFSD